MGEAIEPYIKEDRNVDKVRAAAADACSRLGQFRMPFCWTAIELAKIVRGIPLAMETSDQDSNGSKTNSLERKYSQGGSQLRNIYTYYWHVEELFPFHSISSTSFKLLNLP